MIKDYYQILGIPHTASNDEIHKAYKKLAIKYHPDKNPGDSSTEKNFVEINEANEILSDPIKRREYDLRNSMSGDFNFFADMFSDGINRRKASDFSDLSGLKKEPPRGSDINMDIHVTLEEIFSGCQKTLNYRRNIQCRICAGTGAKTLETCSICSGNGFTVHHITGNKVVDNCPHCFGSGLQVDESCDECSGRGIVEEPATIPVSVPRGVEESAVVVIPGKGNAGIKGGPYGNLMAKINILSHKDFTREGLDLHSEVEVSVLDLILGCTVKIPVIDGGTIDMVIPELSKVDTIFRVRNRGLKNRTGTNTGHIFVSTKIIIPDAITDDVREMYEKIRIIEKII